MEDKQNGIEQKQKAARTRSPAYPAINLETAVKRAKEFYANEHRNPSTLTVVVGHWGFAEKSSGGLTTAAALKSFGLMRDLEGTGVRKVQLTELALRIVLDERPDSRERAEAIKKAALLPKMHIFLWNKYGPELPSDANLRHELIFDWKFNENAVADFIQEYRQTISFAKLTESDKISISVEDKGDSDHEQEQDFKIGDYVQWESRGVLQMPEAKRVREFSEDGEWAFLEGSDTGVPVSEIITAAPPARREQEPSKLPTNLHFQKLPRSPEQQPAGTISTPVGKDEDRVVFAHVRFDAALRKEFVTSLKKYLDYLETTLQ